MLILHPIVYIYSQKDCTAGYLQEKRQISVLMFPLKTLLVLSTKIGGEIYFSIT